MERMKMDRDEKERMDREEKERQKLQVNRHFEESFKMAEQKHKNNWSHPMQAAEDQRRPFEHAHPPHSSHVPPHQMAPSRLRDDRRLPHQQMVNDSIYKAFHRDEPPPAHSKEKHFPAHKVHPYPTHEKQSVIVQSAEHSNVPKQRGPVPGRASPYQQQAQIYKSYDYSPLRGTTPAEISKVRHPQPPPSASSSHHDSRYYPSKAPLSSYTSMPSSRATVTMIPNAAVHHATQQHVIKPSKVNSPPPSQVYTNPDIRTQQAAIAQIKGPPPAHSSSNRGLPPPPPSHEPRPLVERGAPHEVHRGAYPPTIPSPHQRVVSNYSSDVPPPTPPQPLTLSVPINAQTLPLNLGTKDDPSPKRRTRTPTPQDLKKMKLDASHEPCLSKVSEPSPLYSSEDLTTITSVENRAVTASALISSKASQVTASPSNLVVTKALNSASPVTLDHQSDKSNSPTPQAGADGSSKATSIHKIKKHWLQRHESGAEIVPSTRRSSNTPPIATASINGNPKSPSSVKSDDSNSKSSWKSSRGLSNGRYNTQDMKDIDDSSSTESDDDGGARRANRGSATRQNRRAAMKRHHKRSSESESDKESDGSECSVKRSSRGSQAKDEPKKRGRKPKKQGLDKDEGPPKHKKIREENGNGGTVGGHDPLKKPPLSQLKKTGETFLQDGSCFEVSSKIPKCRECRWTPNQRKSKTPNIFCRFYAFRRLKYTKSGQLTIAGFSDPVKDAYEEDRRLWKPDSSNPVRDLDVEKSKFLITHVGDQLCELVEQEKQASKLHMAGDNALALKRVVQGVREMCDVCETTLFNIHWACSKCGFVVCIDCYKSRKNGTVKIWNVSGTKDRDEFQWLLCISKIPHEQDKLMLTQIISGEALTELGKLIHEVRHEHNIPQLCDCEEAKKYKSLSETKNNGVKEEPKVFTNGKDSKTNGNDDNSNLNFFADVALGGGKKDSSSSDSDSDSDGKGDAGSTLRQLLVRQNESSNTPSSSRPNSRGNLGVKETGDTQAPAKKKPKLDTLDDVISCVIQPSIEGKDVKLESKVELKHFVRKYTYKNVFMDSLPPIRIMTKTESNYLYPKTEHSWLCDGKLLRLHQPNSPDNVKIFQDQWKRGQPVLISGVGNQLKPDLWRPYSFSRDFGEKKNDLINCLTGNIVPNQPMRKFWDGFESYTKRLKDEKNNSMILKLKDWPPGEDFAISLPKRFKDLMDKLPLGDYTRRDGVLNLAGRLPECFVKPDLGPKMYIAYGSALHPNKASTNLHLDISDAVNVMCYCGVPKDGCADEDVKAALKAIDEAGCDLLTRRRAREPDTVPGALWHIYHARDADKIRDLLNKVAIAKGVKLEPHHDPIHDQSWYLDRSLREKLYKEYGVEGYSILQCMGDAVFIPAGAPHQVRNLHNCIKVAEDFVSPENVAHCFHLTQEFRHLSDSHSNHEDKLQIKNIIFHAVKDAIAVLKANSNGQIKVEKEEEEESPAVS